MKRKAALLVEPRKFDIVEEEIEPLKDNEILVRVISSGLCHTDLPAYNGVSTIAMGKDGLPYKQSPVAFPTILGHEPVGVVEEVGKNVQDFKAGDTVAGVTGGSFTSHLVLDANTSRFIKMPPEVKEPKRCLLEPITCCSVIVRAATPELGDYAGVVGCGMMGLLCLSGISKSAAFEVVALDLQDSRLELAKKFGATKTINPSKTDAEKKVKEITNGHGLDAVIEITGVIAGLNLASRILRGGDISRHNGRGRILAASFYGKPDVVDAGYEWMFKGLVIHSTHPWYTMDYAEDQRRAMGAFQRGIFPIDKLITHEFPLEDIARAFEIMEKAEDGYIKGIIVP
jgi:threonine dehydrogenase-like Zn-dependent dehydrogenase